MSRRNYTRYIVEPSLLTEEDVRQLEAMSPLAWMTKGEALTFRELPSDDEVQRLQDTINALRMAP